MTAAEATDEGARTVKGLLGDFRTSGFFFLRTPLLPVAAFKGWNGVAKADDGAGDTRSHLRQSLTELLGAPHVADALGSAVTLTPEQSASQAFALPTRPSLQPVRRGHSARPGLMWG